MLKTNFFYLLPVLLTFLGLNFFSFVLERQDLSSLTLSQLLVGANRFPDINFTFFFYFGLYIAFQAALLKMVPGEKYLGPMTKSGRRPQYKDNGVVCYLLTLVTFILLTKVFKLFQADIIYQNYYLISSQLKIFAFFFCLLLYLKGRLSPDCPDAELSHVFFKDFYIGIELHPRVLGIDIKQMTNCRFAMIGWVIASISYAQAEYKIKGYYCSNSLFSAIMVFVYILKFFMWERGYMRSTGIQRDRAGYYICWGCLAWVLGVYSSPTYVIAKFDSPQTPVLNCVLLAVGLASIIINYWADYQRMAVRQCSDIIIWGEKAKILKAPYIDDSKAKQESILLYSGFWGVSRHFHYLPQLIAAYSWSLTGGFKSMTQLFYALFLTGLLLHRLFRDEAKCRTKYGQKWKEYCRLVPYKMIPGIL